MSAKAEPSAASIGSGEHCRTATAYELLAGARKWYALHPESGPETQERAKPISTELLSVFGDIDSARVRQVDPEIRRRAE